MTKETSKELAKKSGSQLAKRPGVAEIRKTFGEDSLMMLGDSPRNIERVSTGIMELDNALGGGWPMGRIMEIMGPESSGKTTIALYMIKAALAAGLTVAFIDLENALDPVFAQDVVGVDIDQIMFAQPESAEKALDLINQMVRLSVADLIVVDSVAALTPRAEIEGDMGDSHMGLVARLMSQALRKITNEQTKAESKTTVLFINQLREKIGVMFGNPETTTGGRALKFYSSVRIDTRSPDGPSTSIEKPGQIRSGDDVLGKRIRCKVIKNKTAPPFRTCVFDLMFDIGVDENVGILKVATERGIFTQSGAYYYDQNGERLGQGYAKSIEALRANPELVAQTKELLFREPQQ